MPATKNWTLGLAALGVSAGLLFIGFSARADALPERMEFGKIPLGSTVHAVPRWAVKSSCRSVSSFASCRFFDSNGVEYDLVDGDVCEKTFHVDARNKRSLPYGVRFESSKSEIVAYLSRRLKLKFSDDGSRTMRADDLAPDIFDGSALLLEFGRGGKLTSVNLVLLCT